MLDGMEAGKPAESPASQMPTHSNSTAQVSTCINPHLVSTRTHGCSQFLWETLRIGFEETLIRAKKAGTDEILLHLSNESLCISGVQPEQWQSGSRAHLRRDS